jgi:replicative DNA helicase
MAIDGIALEQTVLGHALNDSACYQLFISDVQWKDFGAQNHQVIAFCLQRMGAIGIQRPDEDTFQLVVDLFPGEEKDYGGAEYLRELRAAFAEPTQNYQSFVERLKLQAAKIRISESHVKDLLRICNDPKTGATDLRNVLNGLHEDVERANSSSFQFKDSTELGTEYLTYIESRKSFQFYTTGFAELDGLLAEGFAPKQITVMAGFTGMAKSTVAINMAHRIAVKGIGTAVFSMESTDMSMMDKLVSTLTQIPLRRLKKEVAELTDQEKGNIQSAINQIAKVPILINDQASMSVDGMLYQLQSARRRGYDPKVVFIDLFGKIEDVDTGDNLASRIQKEMKRMRVLAKTLDIHFVCVVQIGRQGFGRQRGGRIKRPTLIDIKNANAYAEEANLVLLLHRNKYYLPDLPDDILEIDVAKQRDGESNTRAFFEIFPDRSTIMDTDKRPHDFLQQEDGQNGD